MFNSILHTLVFIAALGLGMSAVASDQQKTQNQKNQEVQKAETQQTKKGQTQSQAQRSPQSATPQMVPSVDELNENLGLYLNELVSVTGEVENRIDNRTLVLESGGWWNDEIYVILPQDYLNRPDALLISEDQKLRVIGVPRTMAVVDIEREYGWDFSPEVEAEFESSIVFIDAQRVMDLGEEQTD